MEFSEKLRQLREEKHLTQEQVARELGVSRQAISNWENNKNLPDLETVIRLSRFYSVTLDELMLGGSEPMNDITEKLIEDGSENRRLKTAQKILRTGALLMAAGLLCFILKSVSVEYIDAEGILHENFFYLPIGFLFLFSGLITLVVGLVKAICSRRKI
jgi:transcriptional regulator with XRE-family HTH domain